jgi:hypothetical protein
VDLVLLGDVMFIAVLVHHFEKFEGTIRLKYQDLRVLGFFNCLVPGVAKKYDLTFWRL